MVLYGGGSSADSNLPFPGGLLVFLIKSMQ